MGIQKIKSLTSWNSYFDIGENTLRVTGSNWSGREQVFVDDVLVSNKINWTLKSVHSITVSGTAYEVTIELLTILKPQVRVQLLKNGDIKDEDYVFSGDGSARNKGALVWTTGLAFIAGYLSIVLLEWLLGI